MDMTNPTAPQPTSTYLRYKLDRCFVKSWSTSGDADTLPVEQLSFGFTPIKDY